MPLYYSHCGGILVLCLQGDVCEMKTHGTRNAALILIMSFQSWESFPAQCHWLLHGVCFVVGNSLGLLFT